MNKKTIIKVIAAASFAMTGLCGTALADKGMTRQHIKRPPVNAKGVQATTLFDLGHAEISSPLKDGSQNYTLFYDIVKLSGEEAGVNREAVTKARLLGVRNYIIAGPIHPLSTEEVAALESFVKEGGNLLVLLHVSPPVAPLTNSFGIAVSNFILAEKNGVIGDRAQDFFITNFNQHPVTSGISKISVYGTWGLQAEGQATAVAATSSGAWADMNRDRQLSDGEPQQEFGIVAASSHGKGKVVVIADDAPFTNQYIGEADNRRLAENILRWFKQ